MLVRCCEELGAACWNSLKYVYGDDVSAVFQAHRFGSTLQQYNDDSSASDEIVSSIVGIDSTLHVVYEISECGLFAHFNNCHS